MHDWIYFYFVWSLLSEEVVTNTR